MTIRRLLFSCFLVFFVTFSSSATADEKEINCLAKNIYYESGGEPPFGREAVADSTIERYLSSMFRGSICDIVYQKNPQPQFSWTVEGKPAPKGHSWIEAKQMAREYYANRYKPENRFFRGQNIMFFHRTDISDKAKEWFVNHPKLMPLMVIGWHVFYIYKEDMPDDFIQVASSK